MLNTCIYLGWWATCKHFHKHRKGSIQPNFCILDDDGNVEKLDNFTGFGDVQPLIEQKANTFGNDPLGGFGEFGSNPLSNQFNFGSSFGIMGNGFGSNGGGKFNLKS